MKRSTDRILTTHVGSLARTPEIARGMKALTLRQPYDPERLARAMEEGVHQVVRKQAEVGIDVVSDGEYGRLGFRSYVNERLSGLELRQLDPDENLWGDDAERREFSDFFKQYDSHYRYLWMFPDISLDGIPNLPGNHDRFRLVGPISYVGQSTIGREVTLLRSALNDASVSEAFIPADVPTSRKGDRNILDFYPSPEAYLYAVADAMHEEYSAITDAGFLVQLDLAALNPGRKMLLSDSSTLGDDDVWRALEVGVDVLNHALRGIPEDRVRYHHCWGSMNTPHIYDVPLIAFVDLMMKINAQAYSIEAANPRHEHEWMVWKEKKLPDGKIIIPGVISPQTNVVEHPELVAWRIENFASVLGKENIIAGVDCGFSQFWDSIRVHPSVQWAKLQALSDGAALAPLGPLKSQRLWAH